MPLRDYEHMDLPEGITPEEARWYSQQRQQDIDAAVRRSASHVTHRATIGFLILLVGLLIAFKVGSNYNADRVKEASANRNAIVTSGRVVSVAGCNRDFKTISSLRGILIRAQTSVRLQRKADILSEKQYQRAVSYYQKALDEVRLPDCRAAESVVTDDPTKARPIPEPLYPGGPGDPEAQK